MEQPTGTGLVRGLRKWDLIAVAVNGIIGAGIFGLPSAVYANIGAYSLLAFVACAIVVTLIILCFAEVGSRFSETGGPYLYAREAFGSVVGFEVGWLMWLARIAAIAALGNLGIGYLSYFVPAFGDEVFRGFAITAIVLLLTIVNLVGVRVTAAVTNAFTIGKLIPLLLVALVGLFFVQGERYDFSRPPDYRAFSQAALLLVFAYTGFEGAVIPAGEMRDPGRHAPFALLTGIGFVACLYMLVQTVCIGLVPNLATAERPLAEASFQFLGTAGASIVAVGALISVTGTMNALMFATPRLLFAMAEHRQLPAAFLATHPRFQTPTLAVVSTAAVTLVFTLSSTFLSALTISAVIRLLAYATTCAALPALRLKAGMPPATFVAPAGFVVSGAAVGLSLWLLSNTTMNEARLAAFAALAGIAVYAAARSRDRRTMKP
jgi:amino acid transporter